MKIQKKRNICAVIFLVCFCLPAFARDVKVVIEDADIALPLEGAVILSWDGTEHECDADGAAVISVPDGRPVPIRAAYPGYENGRFVIGTEGDTFTFRLALAGMMESSELVVEAARPGQSETKPGRSVSMDEKTIAQTAEIGVIEDVMSGIKLLPGVGYSGMFNAKPSIRGGDPGDLMSALDGYYIENPYHWGSGFSIFAPRMVQSAQLSHGVFSTRYGHSISGLLDITSKKPSPTETEIELNIGTSTADMNLSLPLFGRGGLMFMGRVTYYDPVIGLFKALGNVTDNEILDMTQYIKTAPYIRSLTVNGNYRFNDALELGAAAFIGVDGVGVFYKNESKVGELVSKNDISFDYSNTLGFLTSHVTFSPTHSTILKFVAGGGFTRSVGDGFIANDVNMKYSDEFKTRYPLLTGGQDRWSLEDHDTDSLDVTTTANAQGRVDFDWDLSNLSDSLHGFIAAAGVQEMYTHYRNELDSSGWTTLDMDPDPDSERFANVFIDLPNDSGNQRLNSSAYTLVEYTAPNNFFAAELGLRLDHLWFAGKDFSIQTQPVLNPRLNTDFHALKDKGILHSLSFTLGTGLFSSDNDTIANIDGSIPIKDFELRPNRSWTSIIGVNADFPFGFSFNLEGYYKYVFDRTYTIGVYNAGGPTQQKYLFDGEGRVWGFDLQLQKLEGRWVDGWLSYSFNAARYRNPNRIPPGYTPLNGNGIGNGWYFPSFHRYHYLNLVLNFHPRTDFNIHLRMGFASGRPLEEVGAIHSTPVALYGKDGKPTGKYIENFTRDSKYSDTLRTTFSFPVDIKLSYVMFNPAGKSKLEFYFAVENVMALFDLISAGFNGPIVFAGQGNKSFNTYTGQEVEGSLNAVYEMPVPIPSFGFKWSY